MSSMSCEVRLIRYIYRGATVENSDCDSKNKICLDAVG